MALLYAKQNGETEKRVEVREREREKEKKDKKGVSKHRPAGIQNPFPPSFPCSVLPSSGKTKQKRVLLSCSAELGKNFRTRDEGEGVKKQGNYYERKK